MTLQITIRNSIIIIDVSCITLCDGYQNMFSSDVFLVITINILYIFNLENKEYIIKNIKLIVLRYDVILIILHYLQKACIS